MTAKPSRAKLTIVGTPLGPPQPVQSPNGDVLQLVFKCEMQPSLPKGLPVLGPTVVAVWCTAKQSMTAG